MSTSLKTESYRPDIDGLRAVAVLSVMLFHAEFAWFKAGFLGVDVFFVISGFLITRLIRDEVLAGTFTFKGFYLRRARRLLPAFFVTLAVTTVFAFCLLTPSHFESFGGSLISSVFSYSNFYFWKQTGYFDVEATLKPLLHTWSLSIEEQFYLVWPACLLLLLRKKPWAAPLGVAALMLVGFWLHVLYRGDEGNAIRFYLTPFRVCEFAIGALMVWLVRYQFKWGILREIAVLLGLWMIATAIHEFPHNMVNHLYYIPLVCVGAALMIYGGTARVSGLLLRNPLMVGIGKISYSLYLVHWPLFVLYRYWRFEEISETEVYGLFAASFALALIMYYKVEKPCRYTPWFAKYPLKQQLRYVSYIVAVFALSGYIFKASEGLSIRVPKPELTPALAEVLDYKACEAGKGVCPDSGLKHIDHVIIGDSHAHRMPFLLGHIAIQQNKSIAQRAHLGCFGLYQTGLECAKVIDDLFEDSFKLGITKVFLVSNWNPMTHGQQPDFMFAKMKSTIHELKKRGIEVYVVGAMPFMWRSPANCCGHPFTVTAKREFVEPLEYQSQAQFNADLKKVVLENGGRYMDIFSQLCSNGVCRVSYQNLPLYGDRMHYNSKNITGFLLEKYAGKTIDFNDLFLKK
jgi:peptidoglycan/LPS O-acetylase OafA/YrhL